MAEKGGNIFQLDRLLIPINIEKTHWFLAVVWFNKRTIQVYDSMPSRCGRRYYMELILGYIDVEHDKIYGRKIERCGWTMLQCSDNNEWAPRQFPGGNDCGVFLCLFMDIIMMGNSDTSGLCPTAVDENGRDWIANSLVFKELIL